MGLIPNLAYGREIIRQIENFFLFGGKTLILGNRGETGFVVPTAPAVPQLWGASNDTGPTNWTLDAAFDPSGVNPNVQAGVELFRFRDKDKNLAAAIKSAADIRVQAETGTDRVAHVEAAHVDGVTESAVFADSTRQGVATFDGDPSGATLKFGVLWGTGDPEGVIEAADGMHFISDNGIDYVKTAATPNTGWIDSDTKPPFDGTLPLLYKHLDPTKTLTIDPTALSISRTQSVLDASGTLALYGNQPGIAKGGMVVGGGASIEVVHAAGANGSVPVFDSTQGDGIRNQATLTGTTTVALAKLTGGGANGSLTVIDGQITAYVAPT